MCIQSHVVCNGSHRGRKWYRSRNCKTYFWETQGAQMYGLKTPAREVAQALLVVMRRGSLRVAEEITGHKDEMIGAWLKQAAEHAEAMTQVIACDLHVSQVEIDEVWSFVHKKGSEGEPDEGKRWACLVFQRELGNIARSLYRSRDIKY